VAWRSALLLLAYALFVAWVRPALYMPLLSVAVQNRIVAERYLARTTVPEVVLVGSSMSRHLDTDGTFAPTLPEVYNLAFFGGSPLTGNALILKRKTLPRIVVIEVNNLRQPLNAAFVDEVAGHPGAWLRGVCPALRVEYQPLLVLKHGARILGNTVSGRPLLPPIADTEPPTPRLDEGVVRTLHDDALSTEADRAQVKRSLDLLAAQVAELERRGVCVLLLYLPTDPRVEASDFRRFVREAVFERFPKSRWPWSDMPSDGSLRTSDGVHLTGRSAAIAAVAIRKWVELTLWDISRTP